MRKLRNTLEWTNFPCDGRHRRDIQGLFALVCWRWLFRTFHHSCTKKGITGARCLHDEHRLLDVKIEKGFSAFRELNKEPDLSELLSRITMDKRLTTLTSDEAEEMINQQPFFEGILRSAWHARSFKEVPQLGVFTVEICATIKLT